MPQFFQTMPCRVQGFQATLDGYIKSNKYLVSFDDVCNGGLNIFTPAGFADHLGSFFYIPLLANKFDIEVNFATKFFFISYGIICFLISIFFFNKTNLDIKIKIIGSLTIFFLFFLCISISDTYSFYGLTSLALIPMWQYFFEKKLIENNFDIVTFSLFTGIMIAFSESIRGQSGLSLIICLIIYLYFIDKENKFKKLLTILIILLPLIGTQLFFKNLKDSRDSFFLKDQNKILELKKRNIALKNVRSIWHNAYFGLGFLSYDNPNFPKNNDDYSINKVKELNPDIVPFTSEYEKILRKEYFSFIFNYPLYFFKITAAKAGVVLMYIIFFTNIGIYYLYKNELSKNIKYFFLPGIFFNGLIGIVTEPDYTYLLGMFVYCSFMTLFIIQPHSKKN